MSVRLSNGKEVPIEMHKIRIVQKTSLPPAKQRHKAIGEAHRRYTRMINFRKKWRGYLWQGRFASFPMDDIYMFRAARYIEMNPVRAGIVDYPEEYLWSSAKAHLSRKDDSLVKVAPILEKSI